MLTLRTKLNWARSSYSKDKLSLVVVYSDSLFCRLHQQWTFKYKAMRKRHKLNDFDKDDCFFCVSELLIQREHADSSGNTFLQAQETT